MDKRYLLFLCCCCMFFTAFSQRQTTRKEYIEKYADLAVSEMRRTGIPASIKLAQAILESANGNSDLAVAARNHFGIKCHSSWTGKTILKDDDAKNECFRVYNSVYDSYKDHSEFLVNGRRYAFLFELEKTDYKAWAHGLSRAGYATNPNYAALLIRIIEDNELFKYDEPEKHNIVFTEPEKTQRESRFNFIRPPLQNAPAPTGTPPNLKQLQAVDNKFEKSIYENNRTRFIIVQDGETVFSISRKFGIPVWKLFQINDFKPGQSVENGDVVYLERKRNQAEKPYYTHTIKEGETLYTVAQLYAVRVDRLAKMNRRNPDDEIPAGTHIYIRRNLIMFE